MRPFSWLVMAFRSAVRSEVERAMDDRRRVFASALPVSDAELARIKTFLGSQGVTVRAPAAVLAFPAANQNHPEPRKPVA